MEETIIEISILFISVVLKTFVIIGGGMLAFYSGIKINFQGSRFVEIFFIVKIYDVQGFIF